MFFPLLSPQFAEPLQEAERSLIVRGGLREALPRECTRLPPALVVHFTEKKIYIYSHKVAHTCCQYAGHLPLKSFSELPLSFPSSFPHPLFLIYFSCITYLFLLPLLLLLHLPGALSRCHGDVQGYQQDEVSQAGGEKPCRVLHVSRSNIPVVSSSRSTSPFPSLGFIQPLCNAGVCACPYQEEGGP